MQEELALIVTDGIGPSGPVSSSVDVVETSSYSVSQGSSSAAAKGGVGITMGEMPTGLDDELSPAPSVDFIAEVFHFSPEYVLF